MVTDSSPPTAHEEPYAMAKVIKSASDWMIKGAMVTFQKTEPVWQSTHKISGGLLIVLGDFERKGAGWRAKYATHYQKQHEESVLKLSSVEEIALRKDRKQLGTVGRKV